RPSIMRRTDDGTSDPPRVLCIGSFEQLPRTLGAYDRGSGDGRQHRPTLHEELGRAYLDAIDERDRGDGRAGSDRGLEALDVDEGIGVRRAQVDDEVGLVEQPAADRRVGLAR